jgi:hypothetical protein
MADEIRIVVAAQTAIANLDRLATQLDKVSGAMNKVGPVNSNVTQSLDKAAEKVSDLDKAIDQFSKKTEGGLAGAVLDPSDAKVLEQQLRMVAKRLGGLKDDYKDVLREQKRVAKEFEPGGRGVDGTKGQQEWWGRERKTQDRRQAEVTDEMRELEGVMKRGNRALQDRINLHQKLHDEQVKLGQSMADDIAKRERAQYALGEKMAKAKDNEIEIDRQRRAAQEKLGAEQNREWEWRGKEFKRIENENTGSLAREARHRASIRKKEQQDSINGLAAEAKYNANARKQEQQRTTAGLLAEAKFNERMEREDERRRIGGLIAEAKYRDKVRQDEAKDRKERESQRISGLVKEAEDRAKQREQIEKNDIAGKVKEAQHREGVRETERKSREKAHKESMEQLQWKMRNEMPLTAQETALRDKLARKIDDARRGKGLLTAEERKLASAMRKTKSVIPDVTRALEKQSGALEKVRITIARIRNATLLWNFAMQPLMEGVRKAVTGFTEYEKAITGVTRIGRRFGETQSDMSMAMNEFTASGLLDVTEVSQGLKNLLSTGIGLPKAVEVMRKLADTASFNRQGMLSLGEALVGATQGFKNLQSRMLDNAGLTKRISNIINEQAAAEGRSAKNIDQKTKYLLLANGIIQREAIPFQDDFAKAADSTTGSFARLNLGIDKFWRQMGKFADKKQIFSGVTDLGTALASVAERLLMSDAEKLRDTLVKMGTLDKETARLLGQEVAREYATELLNTYKTTFDEHTGSVAGISPMGDFIKNQGKGIAGEIRDVMDIELPQLGDDVAIEKMLGNLEGRLKTLSEEGEKWAKSRKQYMTDSPTILAHLENELALEKKSIQTLEKTIQINKLNAANNTEVLFTESQLQPLLDKKIKRVKALTASLAENRIDTDKAQKSGLAFAQALGIQERQLRQLIGLLRGMLDEELLDIVPDKAPELKATAKQLKEVAKWWEKFLKTEDQFKETMFSGAAKNIRKFTADANDTVMQIGQLKEAIKDPALKRELEALASGFAGIFGQKQISELERFAATVSDLTLKTDGRDSKYRHPLLELEQDLDKAVKPFADKAKIVDQLFMLDELQGPEAQKILKEIEDTLVRGWIEAEENAIQNFKLKNQDAKRELRYEMMSPIDRDTARITDDNRDRMKEIDRLAKIGAPRGGFSPEEARAAAQLSWDRFWKEMNELGQADSDADFDEFQAKLNNVAGAFDNMGRAAAMAGKLGFESLEGIAFRAEKGARALGHATDAFRAYRDLQAASTMLGQAAAGANVASFALMAGMSMYSAMKGPDEDDEAERNRRSRDFGATINRGPQTINYNPTLVVTADGSVYFSQDSMEVVVDEQRRIMQESIEGSEITVR